jgi:hypothetical protein
MTYARTDIMMASGTIVNLAMPASFTIKLRDIAHHLATINRFSGAPALPYSVAQHSVVVAKIIEQLYDEPLVALQALLHDAHEAYTSDVPTPTQEALGQGRENLKAVQHQLDFTIHAALGVPMPDGGQANSIRYADRVALATEWRDMMPGRCPNVERPANFAVKSIPWHKAEEKFLKEFNRLSMLAGIVAPKIPHSPAFAK